MSRGNTPTIKRILREAAELANHPTPDIHAAPLSDSNLFEWHFTIRGPPAPSPYSKGVYHGRISLPTAYPLRPPSFRFLTPTGRFEVNREICLSISGHHEETWQPAWGIRTALTAIRAFMDTDVGGQVGGLECSEEGRKTWAEKSRDWICKECGGSRNEEVLEREKAKWEESRVAGEEKKEEELPEGLKVGYRDEMKPFAGSGGSSTPANPPSSTSQTAQTSQSSQQPMAVHPPAPPQARQPAPQYPVQQHQTPQQHQQQQQQHMHIPPAGLLRPPYQPQRQQPQPNPNQNLDRMIFALLFLLMGLVWRKMS